MSKNKRAQGSFVFKNVKIIYIWILIILLLTSCNKKELKKIEVEQFMYGTSIKIVVYDNDEKKSKDLIEKTFILMEDIDKKYNSKKENSIVYKINKNPLKEFSINNEFYNLIKNAKDVSKFSGGKYDITIGPIMSLWGFDDLNIKNIPEKNSIKNTLKLVNYQDIKLTNTKISLSKIGQKIDTGSFLKGYAIYKGREFLEKNGIKHAMITAISSIDTIGEKPNEKPFKIGVQNPKNSEELLYTIDLAGKALGVAGDYQTFVEINGKKYHHIIDATNGYPSNYNSMVLLLGKNAYDCDLYDTALFMLKPEEILKFVEKNKEFEVFIVDKSGKQYFSSGIKKYLKKLEKE